MTSVLFFKQESIMKMTTITEMATIILPLVTLLGVFVSLIISHRTLNEVKQDRLLSQKPFLIFEAGGRYAKVEIKKCGKTSPGFNPAYIKKMLCDIPEDSISIRFHDMILFKGIGELQNYGRGPALNIMIIWKPMAIKNKGEKRRLLKSEERSDPRYSEEMNERCVGKRNLFEKDKTGMIHLPMFIEKDFN